VWVPYCNGTPYADDTYWHKTGSVPFMGIRWNPPVCVLPGDIPAPPGGCTE